MIEKKININGCDCFYLKKSGRYDTKHLVVIFSGFSGDGKPVYNYQNSLAHCPADILWIKDYFKGGESYYLCANGIMDVEDIVYNLIKKTLDELNLTNDDCTILGGSKGGSAALYYGMKYNFKNIIATVPQFYIGSYVEQDWVYAFKHMMGDRSDSDIKYLQKELDGLIISQIKNSDSNKNLYIITSQADPQFKTEIEKNLVLLKRFSNFNCIYANSDLIQRHNQVNRHILPVTISLITMTAMGLAPRFDATEIKYRSTMSDGLEYLKPVANLNYFEIKDGMYFLEGDAYINGIPCPEYSDLSIYFILKNDNEEIELLLAKGQRKASNLFEQYKKTISYYRGNFCTPQYAGLPIDSLPVGSWRVFMKINARGIIREFTLNTSGTIDVHGVGRKNKIHLCHIDNQLMLSVTIN